jgi:hypothetical protein
MSTVSASFVINNKTYTITAVSSVRLGGTVVYTLSRDGVTIQSDVSQNSLLTTFQRLAELQPESAAAASNAYNWVLSAPNLLGQVLPADTPPSTSTQTTGAATTAQDDASSNPATPPPLEVNAQGRITTPPENTSPTNAESTLVAANGGVDQNTNAPTRTFETTQAPVINTTARVETSPTLPNTGPAEFTNAEGDRIVVNPSPFAGQGALDDNTEPEGVSGLTRGSQTLVLGITTATRTTEEVITPQPNILDNLFNYTYNASVYLLRPEIYKEMILTNRKIVSGDSLLFQTGGAPLAGGNAGTQGRNRFFTEDFYIDSLTIENALPGKVPRAAHMVTDIKFTVVEPNGITLLDRLYDAVQDFKPTDATGAVNYGAAQYLLVVRWYGYDQNGQPVSGSSSNSDPNAVVEKFIPFVIKRVNWSVANRLVSYDFECAPVQQYASTVARATIPYDIELSQTTVKEVLLSNAEFGVPTLGEEQLGVPTGAPAKANAAGSTRISVRKGLIQALNDFQQERVRLGEQEVADEYVLTFAKGADAIENAQIILPGNIKNLAATGMAPPVTRYTGSLDPRRVSVDNSVRNIAVTAGQQVVQVLDLIIRNSSYIYNQANTQNIEVPDIRGEEPLLNSEVPGPGNKRPQDFVRWFNISFEAVPIKYDSKRNDYAYTFFYIISPFITPNFSSQYFPIPKFNGLHKVYNYWFTGENIAVLDYQATFNHLYNITVTGGFAGQDAEYTKLRNLLTSSMREIPKYAYHPASTESRTGADLKGNEVGANAAEYLYSPSDLGRLKMRIIGDPAWIQQGAGGLGIDPENFDYNGFLPDGTINFDSQQVLFEVAWQRPRDYDIKKGIADPYNTESNRNPIQSYVYQAVKVVSEFRQGKFEQILDGTLYFYPLPNSRNTIGSTTETGQSQTAAGNFDSSRTNNSNTNSGTGALSDVNGRINYNSGSGPRAEPAANFSNASDFNNQPSPEIGEQEFIPGTTPTFSP